MDIKQASCIGGSLLPGRHQVFDFLLLVIVELRSSTADAACFARQSNPALVRSRRIALSNSANAPQSASSWAQRGGRVNRLGEAQKANPSCCRGRDRKRTIKHVEPMLYRWIPVSASAQRTLESEFCGGSQQLISMHKKCNQDDYWNWNAKKKQQ